MLRFEEAFRLVGSPVVSGLAFVASFLAVITLFWTSLGANLQIIGLGRKPAFLKWIRCAMSIS